MERTNTIKKNNITPFCSCHHLFLFPTKLKCKVRKYAFKKLPLNAGICSFTENFIRISEWKLHISFSLTIDKLYQKL